MFIIFISILAAAIRAHPDLRGVKGGDKEHKLLLYADDILAVISDPLASRPHLMDTSQSFSKLSGYTINWNKSEAMPLSKLCLPFMVEKFNFPQGNEIPHHQTFPTSFSNFLRVQGKWQCYVVTHCHKINYNKPRQVGEDQTYIMGGKLYYKNDSGLPS